VFFSTELPVEAYRDFLLWFMRSAGIIMMLFGLTYWAPIIGFVAEPDQLITALPVHLQIVTIIFAVLLPVAGVGLWLGAAWGIGLIAISMVLRSVLILGFPDLFRPQWVMVAAHIGIIAIYVATRFLIHRHR
jgi:hypothetical protein